MAYQVLARKWRPQTFAEVVGQEHISRTLKNAIIQNRIGHAYLFVGSRGIGKTTSARIFAKALNCPNNHDGEPCCKCQSCMEVVNGTSMDVIEIDGASHNKVEDIRDIRDNVQYAPAHGRYKIYIIDEVHMLTVQAWNALLKTLEEPPPHVIFLFATTEPHKVLPTIISRCQRFDLKRIPVPLIVSRLKQIAQGEKINIEDGALGAIARAADGGMRDAQSIFDQMIAFCGGMGEGELIREQDVIDVFGIASGLELRAIASAIFTNNLNDALQVVQKLADGGRDLERLYADLIEYIRNIMVAGLCNGARDILEVSDTEFTDMTNIGKALDPRLVQRVLQVLVAQEWSFRAALNKRIYLEATLAKVVLEAHSVQMDDIMAYLGRISGTLPADKMPQRPQIVIPPPNITLVAPPARPALNSAPQAQAKTEEPKPESNADEAKKAEEAAKAAEEAAKLAEAKKAEEAAKAAEEAKKAEADAKAAEEAKKAEEAAKAAEEAKKAEEAAKAAEEAKKAKEAAKAAEEAKKAEEAAKAAEEAKKAEEAAKAAEEAKKAEEAAKAAEEAKKAAEEAKKAAEEAKKAKKAEEAAKAVAEAKKAEEAKASEETVSEVDDAEEEQGDDATSAVSNETSSLSSSDLNTLLNSAGMMDMEDEMDPALADASVPQVMDGYNPDTVFDRLCAKLAEMGGEDSRLSDLFASMQPQSLGQYGLTVNGDQSRFSKEDIAFLNSRSTQTLINQAYKTLHLSGSVKINMVQDEQLGTRIRYRHANFIELQRISGNPAVQKVNEILGTSVTDARIPEQP